MKILDKLKNSRIGAFFRFLKGQKALPKNEEILEEENNNVEKTSHEKFAQEVKKDANDLSRMTRSQAIIKILRDIGVREPILKNEDAAQEILKIARNEIKDITYINNENEQEVKTRLTEIVKEGRIEKVEEKTTEKAIERKSITIDVDEHGRLDIAKSSRYEKNLNDFVNIKLHSEKSEEEALKESGYEAKVIYEHTVIDCGVEMEKSYQIVENAASELTGKDSVVKIKRNPDLVTASVEVKNLLTNEVRRTNNRWANIYSEGSQKILTILDEEGNLIVETDIEKIDKLGEDWCLGSIPSNMSEEYKKTLIENKQDEVKEAIFDRLIKRINSRMLSKRQEDEKELK